MTTWPEFLAAQRHAGKTMQDAATLWRTMKPPASARTRRRKAPTTAPAPSAPAPGLHRLDTAVPHSKIVQTTVGPVLATPEATVLLPKDDVARGLPVGAKIEKLPNGRFRATQLDPAISWPDAEYATAGEAIADFVPHFHPRGA